LRAIPVLSAAVVILLVAAGLLALQGSGNGSSPQSAVVDAVNTVFADKTAHVSFEESLGGPTTAQVSGTGDVNFTQNAMQLDATADVGGQSESFEYVYLGSTIYVHVPNIEQLLPGRSWVSIDLAQLAQAAGSDGSIGSLGSNPVSMLHLLANEGNAVTPIGTSTIDGTTVQGYAIAFDPSVINADLHDASLPAWMRQVLQDGVTLDSITSDVYVDGSGNLRRDTSAVTETVGSATVAVRSQANYSHFGETIAISAPPAGEVATFGQLLQAAGSSISSALSG
jgi:hypothetical protein